MLEELQAQIDKIRKLREGSEKLEYQDLCRFWTAWQATKPQEQTMAAFVKYIQG